MCITRPRRGISALLGVALLGALTGCTVNPATGERMLSLMSWEQERAMGAQAAPQFTAEFGGEVPDQAANQYVERVGKTLTGAAVTQAKAYVPTLEWEYTLLNSPVINAFALPGGKVFISRGLVEKLNNEAEMAGVIGHEIGHVMARHGNQRISQQVGMNLIVAGAAIAVGAADKDSELRKYGQYAVPAMAIGGNVVLLSYGRNEELEADALGMQYMSAVGYDPAAQRAVMEILQREAGGGGQPEWLSTHPHPESRIARINEMLAGEYAHTQNNPDFKTFPGRFKTDMLNRLAKLPMPKAEQGLLEIEGRTFAMSPVLWCAHCRGGSVAHVQVE